MKQEKLKLIDKLCIYGDFYTILSSKCYGCYNFNYICGGPEEGVCYGGEFEFDKYSAYAHKILKEQLDQNPFLFARLTGETPENLLKALEEFKSDMTESEKLNKDSFKNMAIIDIEKTLSYSDEEIANMKKEYLLDLDLDELDLMLHEMYPKAKDIESKENCEDFNESQQDVYTNNTEDENQNSTNNALEFMNLSDDEIPF